MRGPRVVVYEGTGPRLKFRLKKHDPSKPGATLSYSLVGASVSFNVKEDPDDTTDLFAYTTGDDEITILSDGIGADYSEIEVECAATDLDTPGNYYYRIVVTISSIPDIVSDGIFEVVNV